MPFALNTPICLLRVRAGQELKSLRAQLPQPLVLSFDSILLKATVLSHIRNALTFYHSDFLGLGRG